MFIVDGYEWWNPWISIKCWTIPSWGILHITKVLGSIEYFFSPISFTSETGISGVTVLDFHALKNGINFTSQNWGNICSFMPWLGRKTGQWNPESHDWKTSEKNSPPKYVYIASFPKSWGYPNSWMVYNSKSYLNGWFAVLLLAGKDMQFSSAFPSSNRLSLETWPTRSQETLIIIVSFISWDHRYRCRCCWWWWWWRWRWLLLFWWSLSLLLLWWLLLLYECILYL